MRWGNPRYVVVVVVLLVALGMRQAVSDVLAKSAAQRGSIVTHFPSHIPSRWVFFSTQRLLAARVALAVGDRITASREIAALGPCADRSALEGQLAEQEGDLPRALEAYLSADDFEGLNRVVSRMKALGDFHGALRLQQMIVEDLERNRRQPDALADACWRLGQMYAMLGYQVPRAQNTYRRQALAAYERALVLAPFSQKYLLNAGYEAFDLGNLERAAALFMQAREADPKSTYALVGLGRIAFLRGNLAQAHGYLSAARAIDPRLPDVQRLARQLRE